MGAAAGDKEAGSGDVLGVAGLQTGVLLIEATESTVECFGTPAASRELVLQQLLDRCPRLVSLEMPAAEEPSREPLGVAERRRREFIELRLSRPPGAWALQQLPSSLTELGLTQCGSLHPSSLVHIRGLTNLTRLSLRDLRLPAPPPHQAAEGVADPPAARQAALCRRDAAAAAAATGYRNGGPTDASEEVVVAASAKGAVAPSCAVAASLEHWSRLVRLQELEMVGLAGLDPGGPWDAVLPAFLASLPALTRLAFHPPALSDVAAALDTLERCPCLRRLELGSCAAAPLSLQDGAWRALAAAPCLEQLLLGHCDPGVSGTALAAAAAGAADAAASIVAAAAAAARLTSSPSWGKWNSDVVGSGAGRGEDGWIWGSGSGSGSGSGGGSAGDRIGGDDLYASCNHGARATLATPAGSPLYFGNWDNTVNAGPCASRGGSGGGGLIGAGGSGPQSVSSWQVQSTSSGAAYLKSPHEGPSVGADGWSIGAACLGTPFPEIPAGSSWGSPDMTSELPVVENAAVEMELAEAAVEHTAAAVATGAEAAAMAAASTAPDAANDGASAPLLMSRAAEQVGVSAVGDGCVSALLPAAAVEPGVSLQVLGPLHVSSARAPNPAPSSCTSTAESSSSCCGNGASIGATIGTATTTASASSVPSSNSSCCTGPTAPRGGSSTSNRAAAAGGGLCASASAATVLGAGSRLRPASEDGECSWCSSCATDDAVPVALATAVVSPPQVAAVKAAADCDAAAAAGTAVWHLKADDHEEAEEAVAGDVPVPGIDQGRLLFPGQAGDLGAAAEGPSVEAGAWGASALAPGLPEPAARALPVTISDRTLAALPPSCPEVNLASNHCGDRPVPSGCGAGGELASAGGACMGSPAEAAPRAPAEAAAGPGFHRDPMSGDAAIVATVLSVAAAFRRAQTQAAAWGGEGGQGEAGVGELGRGGPGSKAASMAAAWMAAAATATGAATGLAVQPRGPDAERRGGLGANAALDAASSSQTGAGDAERLDRQGGGAAAAATAVACQRSTEAGMVRTRTAPGGSLCSAGSTVGPKAEQQAAAATAAAAAAAAAALLNVAQSGTSTAMSLARRQGVAGGGGGGRAAAGPSVGLGLGPVVPLGSRPVAGTRPRSCAVFPALRRLSLLRLDNEGLMALAGCGPLQRQLQQLSVADCGGLRAPGIKALAKLTSLQRLSLLGLPEPFDPLLSDWSALEELRALELGLSRAAAAELAAAADAAGPVSGSAYGVDCAPVASVPLPSTPTHPLSPVRVSFAPRSRAEGLAADGEAWPLFAVQEPQANEWQSLRGPGGGGGSVGWGTRSALAGAEEGAGGELGLGSGLGWPGLGGAGSGFAAGVTARITYTGVCDDVDAAVAAVAAAGGFSSGEEEDDDDVQRQCRRSSSGGGSESTHAAMYGSESSRRSTVSDACLGLKVDPAGPYSHPLGPLGGEDDGSGEEAGAAAERGVCPGKSSAAGFGSEGLGCWPPRQSAGLDDGTHAEALGTGAAACWGAGAGGPGASMAPVSASLWAAAAAADGGGSGGGGPACRGGSRSGGDERVHGGLRRGAAAIAAIAAVAAPAAPSLAASDPRVGAVRLSDNGLQVLLQLLPRLKEVHLHNLPNLTPATLEQVLSRPGLRVLAADGCRQLTPDTCELLAVSAMDLISGGAEEQAGEGQGALGGDDLAGRVGLRLTLLPST